MDKKDYEDRMKEMIEESGFDQVKSIPLRKMVSKT